jgi:hypothetical protein
VVLALDQRERGQDGLEAGGRAIGGVASLCQQAQVASNLPLVPGDQNRLDVGEVLVQRGAADAGGGGAPVRGGGQVEQVADEGAPHRV